MRSEASYRTVIDPSNTDPQSEKGPSLIEHCRKGRITHSPCGNLPSCGSHDHTQRRRPAPMNAFEKPGSGPTPVLRLTPCSNSRERCSTTVSLTYLLRQALTLTALLPLALLTGNQANLGASTPYRLPRLACLGPRHDQAVHTLMRASLRANPAYLFGLDPIDNRKG